MASVDSHDFSQFGDVASSRNGGKILFATDDFFAVAENLIKPDEPEWREGVYTEFGKWMDGWETRRRRSPGHDFCIVQLAASVVLHGIELNTAYFTGNHAPAVSIQAAVELAPEMGRLQRVSNMGSAADDKDLELASSSQDWETVLERVNLRPGYAESRQNKFIISSSKPWRFLRLNIFPDGGIARMRVFGRIIPPEIVPGKEIDLVALVNGGQCLAFTNAHFGHPKNLIGAGDGEGMFDGWETARRLDRPNILQVLPNGLLNHSGSEWCVLKLGLPGVITNVLVDTSHFKGNYPDLVQVEATFDDDFMTTDWETLIPFTKASPHKKHNFAISNQKVFKLIKLTIQPDGGISRLRIFGFPELQESQNAKK